MRHRIFLIGLLLLALSLSGWGGVLAAAFCPHDTAEPSATTEDHDCCRAKLDEKTEHCGGAAAPASSTHEAMATNEMQAAHLATERAADAASGMTLNQATQVCFHCMRHGGLPTTFVVTREPEQKKRSASLIAPQALKPIIPLVAVFAPTPTARQNAPPVTTARRHLLLGVFLV